MRVGFCIPLLRPGSPGADNGVSRIGDRMLILLDIEAMIKSPDFGLVD